MAAIDPEGHLLTALADMMQDIAEAQADGDTQIIREGDDFPDLGPSWFDPLFGGVATEISGVPYVLRLHRVQER